MRLPVRYKIGNAMRTTTSLDVGAHRIATLLDRPEQPSRAGGVVWLPGLKSDMTSTKASAVAAWAEREHIACTRFDYSGHGQSSGKFEDGRISHWLDEADAVVSQLTDGPQVLVGSSTGGYLALLLLRRYLEQSQEAAGKIRALVLIAPAWDLTTKLMWDRFPESARRAIAEQGVYLRPSNYGDGPYAITRGFIEDGKKHLIGPDGFDPGRRIVVLHGLQDEDVPWEHTLDLVSILTGDHVEVEARPEGDHRLSTPEDIALMLAKVSDAL
jgi:pimeloyl-ACP methyl ester carboxylesterase